MLQRWRGQVASLFGWRVAGAYQLEVVWSGAETHLSTARVNISSVVYSKWWYLAVGQCFVGRCCAQGRQFLGRQFFERPWNQVALICILAKTARKALNTQSHKQDLRPEIFGTLTRFIVFCFLTGQRLIFTMSHGPDSESVSHMLDTIFATIWWGHCFVGTDALHRVFLEDSLSKGLAVEKCPPEEAKPLSFKAAATCIDSIGHCILAKTTRKARTALKTKSHKQDLRPEIFSTLTGHDSSFSISWKCKKLDVFPCFSFIPTDLALSHRRWCICSPCSHRRSARRWYPQRRQWSAIAAECSRIALNIRCLMRSHPDSESVSHVLDPISAAIWWGHCFVGRDAVHRVFLEDSFSKGLAVEKCPPGQAKPLSFKAATDLPLKIMLKALQKPRVV